MATFAEPRQIAELRENFPVTVFQHLEHRIRGLRTEVMKRAAFLAREEAPQGAEIYTVTVDHVNRALSELVVEEPHILQELLTLNEVEMMNSSVSAAVEGSLVEE